MSFHRYVSWVPGAVKYHAGRVLGEHDLYGNVKVTGVYYVTYSIIQINRPRIPIN